MEGLGQLKMAGSNALRNNNRGYVLYRHRWCYFSPSCLLLQGGRISSRPTLPLCPVTKRGISARATQASSSPSPTQMDWIPNPGYTLNSLECRRRPPPPPIHPPNPSRLITPPLHHLIISPSPPGSQPLQSTSAITSLSPPIHTEKRNSPLLVASCNSGISTALAGRCTYLTTEPRINTFLTALCCCQSVSQRDSDSPPSQGDQLGPGLKTLGEKKQRGGRERGGKNAPYAGT